MSRTKNSRKGTRWGNWHCWCCKPKSVRIYKKVQAAKREGRADELDDRRMSITREPCWS